MALENEITRVAGGTKDTLKALITKLGGTVGGELIDQYPVLAGGATKPDKWDKGILLDGGTLKDVAGNDISADVKSALDLGAYQFSINDDGDLILTYIGDRAPNYSINEDGDLIMTSESGGTINLGHVRGGSGDSIDVTGAKDGDVLRVRGGKVVTEQIPMFIDLNAAGIYVNPDNNSEPLVFNVSQDIAAKLVEAAKAGGALIKFGYGAPNNTIPVQEYLSGSVAETEQMYLFSGRVFFDSDMIIDIGFSVQPDKDKPKVTAECVLDLSLPIPTTSDNGAFLRVQNGAWVTAQVPAAEGGTF